MDSTLLLIIAAILYFAPWMLAKLRGVTASGGIFVLNLTLGWTLLGWLIALIWAAGGRTD